jgi:hypothetical protein
MTDPLIGLQRQPAACVWVRLFSGK